MPKKTFENLSEEKKQTIIDAALIEFSMNEYKIASISKIVKKANISKGSIYQYFDNKMEFYHYIIKLVTDKKLAYIKSEAGELQQDFFEFYKQILYASIKFDINFPKYSRCLYNAGSELNCKDSGYIVDKIITASSEFIKPFVLEAQRKAVIRSDIELDLIIFMIMQLSSDIDIYINHKYKFSYQNIIAQGINLPINENEIKSIIDNMISFIKTGLILKQ